MVNNFTANILNVVAAKKKPKIIDPRKVAIPLPTSRVPKEPSIVSFKYLLANAIKYQPDEANSEHVTLQSIQRKAFRNGAKGIVTSTLTDLPQYKKLHRWEQVYRCTPADYQGKVVDCGGIVYNCNCPRFLYTWNYTAWSKNASVLNATPEFPSITNPRGLIGGCKHIVVSMLSIRKRNL